MSYLKSLEQDYVLGNLELYREFDSSHFISNAKSAITNKVEAVNMNMKFDYYANMIEKAIASFSNIKINKEDVKEFLTSFNSKVLDDSGILIRDITQSDIGKFKPQYIAQYINMVQVLIDNVIKGEANQSDIYRFMNGSLVDKVEAQVVKTNLTYGTTPKELIKENKVPKVKADSFYIKTKVIPFITNYDKIKQETLAEANAVMNAIRESCESVKAMLGAVETIKSSNQIDFERVKLLNQVSYNTMRGIIDIISFVSFLMIRKINNITSAVISCNELYNDISLRFKGVVKESAFDQNILPTDTKSLSEALINGNADAYSSLANNIYDFHRGMPSANKIEDISLYRNSSLDRDNDLEVDQDNYNKSIYNEIGKAYISISTGLDILGAEGDDYLLVFDDVLKKSGFAILLEERFQNELRNITDVTEYSSSANVSDVNVTDTNIKQRLLSEIRDFGKNMETISAIIYETYKKIILLSTRFDNNINGEYKDMETTNEIKIFLKSLQEQFINMTDMVAQNFYIRLKSLGSILSTLNSNSNPFNNISVVSPVETSSSLNISEAVYESILSDYEEDTKLLFESLERAYYAEKELALRGVKVIFEEETASTNNPTGTNNNQNNDQNKQDTKVTINDNSNNGDNNNANNTGGNVVSNVVKFIEDIIEKYITNVDKTRIKVDNKSIPAIDWINQNKESILSRSYNNVSVNVLPYHNIAPSDITNQIGTVKNAVTSLTQDNLKAISSKDQLYQKLFSFTSIKEANGTINDQLSKYYKVKDAELKTVTIANGELKTIVSNSMIPYCEQYLTNYKTSLDTSLKALAEATDNTIKSYSNDSQNNNGPSIKEKSGWITDAIKKYSGSILNANTDKFRDYLKILSAVAPKVKKEEPTTQNNNNQNNNQNNTTNNEQNNK